MYPWAGKLGNELACKYSQLDSISYLAAWLLFMITSVSYTSQSFTTINPLKINPEKIMEAIWSYSLRFMQKNYFVESGP